MLFNIDELELLRDAVLHILDVECCAADYEGRLPEFRELADKLSALSRTAVADADYDCGFRDRFTLANTSRETKG